MISSCNLSCKHCYYKKNVGFDGKIMHLNDAKNILKQAFDIYGRKMKLVVMGGGEPLLYSDLFELLEYSSITLGINTSLTTNATLIGYEELIKFKKLNVLLHISIEGRKEYNDNIRGKGTFFKITKTILIAYKIGTRVSLNMTLNKNNIEDIAFIIRTFGDFVEYITFSRYIPYIKNKFMKELSRNDYLIVEKILDKYKNDKLRYRQELFFSRNIENKKFNILNIRSLYVLPDMTIYPAWNLIDYKLGDLSKKKLINILNNGKLEKLFNPKNLNGKYCSNCRYKYNCIGDRGVAYFYTKNFWGDDIQCPYFDK